MATPATTAIFDPFDPAFDEPPELREAPPELRCDELPELPDDELRPRDEAEGERRLEALPLLDDALPLLDDALRLLGLLALRLLLLDEELRLLVLEAPWLFGLDPFELLEVACRLFEDLELAWATCPSLGRCPALQNSDTPNVVPQTRWGGGLQTP